MKRRFWKLKEEALDRRLWRKGFGKRYGPALKQTAERITGLLRPDITPDRDIK